MWHFIAFSGDHSPSSKWTMLYINWRNQWFELPAIKTRLQRNHVFGHVYKAPPTTGVWIWVLQEAETGSDVQEIYWGNCQWGKMERRGQCYWGSRQNTMQVWPVWRRAGRKKVWLKCPHLPCHLRKVLAGVPECPRGILDLAEMELHLCPHCAQPSAGMAPGKPVEMTAEGVHAASGPTVRHTFSRTLFMTCP